MNGTTRLHRGYVMDEIQKQHTLGEDDKATPVMIYTDNSLLVGEVVTKKVIRVSTWMRTPMVPQYIAIYSAQIIDLSSGGAPKSQTFGEADFDLSTFKRLEFNLYSSDKETDW